jgi:glycine cleavage system H protein
MEADSSYSLVPEGEVQCVWMDAGLVNYKLCDRGLECDGCPFDVEVRRNRDVAAPSVGRKAAATGVPSEGAESSRTSFSYIVAQRLSELTAQPIPEDVLFHRNHFWMRRSDGDVCRVGISHVAAGLLRPVLSIVRSNAPAPVRLHEPCCWLVVSKGTVTVPSPLEGTMLGFNPALLERPSLLDTDPYGAGWMMEISAKLNGRGLREFFPADNSRSLVQRQVDALQGVFTQAFHHRQPPIGATMFDGGTGMADIESILGTQSYFDVVSHIFRIPLEA